MGSRLAVIKSSRDISAVFSSGRRIATPYFTLIILRRQRDCLSGEGGRVAFVAGKKLGGAVWRNAAKRRLREVVRLGEGSFPGCDVVISAKKRLLDAPFAYVLDSYNGLQDRWRE